MAGSARRSEREVRASLIKNGEFGAEMGVYRQPFAARIARHTFSAVAGIST